MHWLALPVLLAAPSGSPQQPSPAQLSQGDQAEWARRASTIGGMLAAYDRATWVATDAMTASVPKADLQGAGGWVIEPDAGDALRVTFYRGAGSDRRAMFEAMVRGGKVAQSRALADLPLSAGQLRLAEAREAASAELVRHGWQPCSKGPFNTVVLPPPDPGAPVDVYFLTAQPTLNSYPLGGHFRISVGSDGSVASARPFSKQCLTLEIPAGKRPAALVATHLLDPMPTEIHVFTSLAANMPLFVSTPGEQLWLVREGRVAPAPQSRARD